MDKVDTSLSDFVYQTAGGTATAITLTMQTLVNGYFKTFIASANNNGAATTINGKKLYKPGTTTAPNLIARKAYTVWYNQAGDCFFIKASAEGDAIAANVLAGKKFSNDNDTGLVGTLDLSNLVSGNVRSGVTINGVIGKAGVVDTSDANASAGQILNGQSAYINGNKVTGNMPNHSGADSPANSIAGTGAGRIYVRPQAGYYDGSVASYVDDGNFNTANIVNGKSIFGLWGSATAASLGGKKFASGNVTISHASGTRTADGALIDTWTAANGLDFTPSTVIIKLTDPIHGGAFYTIYCPQSLGEIVIIACNASSNSMTYIINTSGLNCTFYGGFKLTSILSQISGVNYLAFGN
ncbi:hypothetical protein [Clostridium saccharoperbutylacetonicum]|uniref:hypothetical protein n=1 Tax=Clostridium saccharoperbutylacetonicum TaxID=36745 RepID=UPI0039E9B9B3